MVNESSSRGWMAGLSRGGSGWRDVGGRVSSKA